MKRVTYKCRFEAWPDLYRFIDLIKGYLDSFTVDIPEQPYHDGELTFTTYLTYPAIISLLHKVPDSHIMAGTLNKADTYTGERRF